MLYNDCVGFLPAPIAPSQLVARLLAQQKYERIQVHKYLFLELFCNSLIIGGRTGPYAELNVGRFFSRKSGPF